MSGGNRLSRSDHRRLMVGDDKLHVVDPEDVTALPREDYCGQCGQVGCGHDGLDRP